MAIITLEPAFLSNHDTSVLFIIHLILLPHTPHFPPPTPTLAASHPHHVTPVFGDLAASRFSLRVGSSVKFPSLEPGIINASTFICLIATKVNPPTGGLYRDWLSLYAEQGSAISSIKEPSGRNTSASDGRVLVAQLGLEPRHCAL